MLSPDQITQLKSGMVNSGAVKAPPTTPSAPATTDWVDSLSKQVIPEPPKTPGTGGLLGKGMEAMAPITSSIQKNTERAATNIANVWSQAPSKLWGDVKQMGEGIQKQGWAIAPKEGGAGTFGAGLLNLLGDTVSTLYAPIGEGISAASNVVSDIPAVQAVAGSPLGKPLDAFNKLQGKLNTWAEQNPDKARLASSAFNTVMGVLGEASGIPEKPLPSLKGTIKNLAGEVKSDIKGAGEVIRSDVTSARATIPQPRPIDEPYILDKYNRAIRPTVSGKATAAQTKMASQRVVNGLKSIAENKSALELTDAEGNVIRGETPKSVDQLSQSIAQTKKALFQKYDALAKQAGEAGVTVDTATISKELDPIINSKALRLTNPGAVKYAEGLQTRLTETGNLDAMTAQDAIENYNNSLKAFYRNPSYDTASQASIDALIANKLRAGLDEGVTSATGEQYQALKNQYGALSSMEKDVAHRNIVWGRQNAVGLAGSLANIASGAELVRGLLRMSPADLITSGAIKGIQRYIQYLNNPDVGVAKIFSEIERSSPASTGSMLAPEGLKPQLGSSPTTTTIPTEGQVTTPNENLYPQKTYYRGGGQGEVIKGQTAKEVINYEQKTLGNKDVVPVPGVDLSKIKSDDLQWLTISKRAASAYGEVEPVKGNFRVVAKDSSGGVLVEKLNKEKGTSGVSPESFSSGAVPQTATSPQQGSGQTITLYRAAPKFPSDKFEKGTYFADNARKARFYSESHYEGDPGDIKVQKFLLPKDSIFREQSTGNYITTDEIPAVPKTKSKP